MTTDDTVPQQIAVITGASNGIGAAFANLLADKGYQLVLVADQAGDLAAVAEDIQDRTGERPSTIAMDLSAPDAAQSLLAQLHDRAVLPDLLINNAGFGLLGNAVMLDADEQANMINLNISTLTDLSVRCGKLMADRGRGGIINVSSVAGMLPGPKMAVYYATKAYILSFTEALSAELKGSGVQVTALAPGVTRTGFHERAGMENALMMKLSAPMSAEAVARIGYDGFRRGRRVVTTGLMNKISAGFIHFITNNGFLPVISRLHRSANTKPRLAAQASLGEKMDQ